MKRDEAEAIEFGPDRPSRPRGGHGGPLPRRKHPERLTRVGKGTFIPKPSVRRAKKR